MGTRNCVKYGFQSSEVFDSKLRLSKFQRKLWFRHSRGCVADFGSPIVRIFNRALRYQLQRLRPFYRLHTPVHIQLAVNALDVAAHRALSYK